MYSNDRFNDISLLEFFLFGGVPETPEPVFERDVHNHSEMRRSRKGSIRRRSREHEQLSGKTVGTVEIDPVNDLGWSPERK